MRRHAIQGVAFLACARVYEQAKASRARHYGQADPSVLCYKRRPVLQRGYISIARERC